MNYKISEDKVMDLIVLMIQKQIDSYYIHDSSKQYVLVNEEGKCLLNYVPISKELYYDHSLREFIEKFLFFMDLDTFKKAVAEYFNLEFPALIVKRVNGAHIVN